MIVHCHPDGVQSFIMSLNNNPNEFLWCQKYRPSTIDECILPTQIKNILKGIVKSGEVQNCIFSGTGGLGKTTSAIAICKMLKLDYLLINCSEDSGIDVLRTKIRRFASTVSLDGSGSVKVVILDEADYANATSTQPALRGFIEEFSSNCRFIFTCNFKNRLLEALHSRLPIVEFNCSKKELADLASQFMGRLKKILDAEGVKYTDKALAEIIIKFAPDWRQILGKCQQFAAVGEIGANAVVGLSNDNLKVLIDSLKNKDFRTMRSWVVNNSDVDSAQVFRAIYDALVDVAAPEFVPMAVITLADYQYKNAFVADRELNTVACLTELMANGSWK